MHRVLGARLSTNEPLPSPSPQTPQNMAAQLGQLRYALQLAVVLNRTIIMPKVSCC